MNKDSRITAQRRIVGKFLPRMAAIVLFGLAAMQLPASQSQDGSGTRIPVIITVLTPYGFEPSKATVPAGRFVLYVINRAGGNGDPDLSIESGNKQELLRTKASLNGLDGWQLLQLPSGQKYKVRLSNHQKAVFEIEVQP